MPIQESITIINNSGKIIGTGKHLVGIFKEAKASYQEKKAAIKSERSVQRAQTFDVTQEPRYALDDYELERHHSYDDVRSRTSRRSHDSHRSRSTRHTRHADNSTRRPRHDYALTETNLKTLSEVSSTAPSIPPRAYRSPYVETAVGDMAKSKQTVYYYAPTHLDVASSSYTHEVQENGVSRSRSDPDLDKHGKGKAIDMNLAYGNVPPDLASRVDLDPAYQAVEKERKAKGLVRHVETLLDEAHCLHHTATSTIAHLQKNPEAAAAVALSLAELSTLLGKMSPGFLTIIKGGSPAVFALLASPQFLIAAGAAVGVTIVMFGGWKIVKRIKEAKAAQAAAASGAIALEAMPGAAASGDHHQYHHRYDDGGVDEALVLEDELSTIESWRRGIVPEGEGESADMELISPEAQRAKRKQKRPADDARSERTMRTAKTKHTSSSHKSRRERDIESSIPERKSSRAAGGAKGDDTASERSHRSTRSKKTERSFKALTEKGEDDSRSIDLVLRPKDRKDSMLKTLFKKKEKEERVTVLA